MPVEPDESVADGDVRRAIRQAQVEKLTTHAKLRRHAERACGRRGVRRFRELIGDRPAPTRSELEDAALALLRRYSFDPRCNVVIDGREADMLIGAVILSSTRRRSTTTSSAPATTPPSRCIGSRTAGGSSA